MVIDYYPAGDVIVDCLKTMWGIGLCVTIPTNLILYGVFLCTNTNTLVDAGWAGMQFLLACLCFGLRETIAGYKYQEIAIKYDQSRDNYVPVRNVLCLILISLWAFRLAGWIFFNRICHGENDTRYEMLAANATSGESAYSDSKPSNNNKNAPSSPTSSSPPKTSSEAAQQFLRDHEDNNNNNNSKIAPDQQHQQQNYNTTEQNKQSDVSAEKKKSPADAAAAESARKKFFCFQFTLQAILVVLPATPLYFVFGFTDQQNPQKSWSFWLGLCISLIGGINSFIADVQVERYRREQAAERAKTGVVTKGLCRVGWWSKSRHPNLFFEVVTWLGFAILGIDYEGSLVSLFGLFGPVVLFLIMKYLTVPATEKSMMRTRPNWEELIKDTNMFWPF